ncbi:MAG TPA: phosphotransferase [Steroidobacteraceae bacterium]|nr:phosphotransferase [Steroidobacteraceae bacterium]
MISEALMQHVPGCENGDAPYSQELIGGGKVNRSFLVRTRRGRFVVRLNESAASDPGLDRDRELALHGAAANAGIAPQVVYAAPDHSCLITEFLDGRLWTPHYFTRMRDLRSLGQRLRALQAVPPPPVARFDLLVAARRYADIIIATDQDEAGRIQFLLAAGADALARAGSAQRTPTIVHSDLHHGNVLTADRVYFIDWEYAQVADPLLDLACVMAYYPRAAAHGSLLLEASGLTDLGTTPEMLGELTNVFTLLTYLWYRARRVARHVPGTDLQLESAALRRLLSLAPDAQPRHTSAANSRESSGAGKRNGDAAGD